ncbi:MAG TPA: 30S ribosomal protein S15 [Candidatus Paceibacterota bacterium]
MLTKRVKSQVIKKFQVHDADTGSAKSQIGLLSRRIDELALHLKKHAKDLHSRRGLIGLVADRRKHLKYLEKTDKKGYVALTKELGLKK